MALHCFQGIAQSSVVQSPESTAACTGRTFTSYPVANYILIYNTHDTCHRVRGVLWELLSSPVDGKSSSGHYKWVITHVCLSASPCFLAAGSSRSHCVVYLMVEKSYSDGKLEYGKLSLVGNAAQASPQLCAIA